LLALNSHKTLAQYTRKVWTEADGLPQDTVRSIAQTDDGYLWLGTDEGLARFDGYDFVVFSKDTGSLRSNSITALCAGHSGRLWIGTPRGLTRYADRHFTTFTTSDGLPDNSITAILEDHAGALWIVAGTSLSRFQNGKFTNYPIDRLKPIYAVRGIYEDSQQQLWISGLGGVVRRAGEEFSTVIGAKEMEGDRPLAMLKDRNNGFWIASNRGLLLLTPDGALKRFDLRDGLPDNLVQAMWEDSDGNLWAGTNGGLSRFENGRFVASSLDRKEERNSVRCLFEDREKNMWVGTTNGLNRFRDDRFTTYSDTEGLPSDEPVVVLQDRAGQIWIGYHNSGLVAFSPGPLRVYTKRDGLPSNEILSLHESRNGDLLISTRAGLSRLHAGHFTNYLFGDPLGRRRVYDAIESQDGHLWIATPDGVHEVMGLTSSEPSAIPGGLLLDNAVVVLYSGREGDLWAGTYANGLWRVSRGNPAARLYRTTDGLGSDEIRSLYQDDDGTLWIGTFGGGLTAFRNEHFIRYTARDGLLSDNISHVEDDGNGNLWLSTPRGICRIAKQQLSDFSAGRIQGLTPENYGVEDGLLSAQSSPGDQTGGGGTRTRDGRLWFTTSRGLAVIDQHARTEDAMAPITQLVGVVVDGRDIDFKGFQKLKPGTAYIQFRYTGIHLSRPERTRFAYKLEGLDRDWLSAASRRVVNYNTLPHGRYRFVVRAMLTPRAASESSFSFEVLPHFYETAWFIWICTGSFFLVMYGIHRYRMTQIHGRFSLVLEERVRLAREIHDTLAQGFIGISSQLDAVAMTLPDDADPARRHLDLARKMARHSITEARRSVADLRASVLEGQNLAAALDSGAQMWTAGSGVKVDVEVLGPLDSIPEGVEQPLLRIAREAVTNVVKHAGASKVGITLNIDPCKLFLRIVDNGRGFEQRDAFSSTGGHFGLIGMRERAHGLGGKLQLTSRPGEGTCVEVTVVFP
jgi:ligand-binding sensor domain-containing protein/signal transduction histidine kinase